MLCGESMPRSTAMTWRRRARTLEIYGQLPTYRRVLDREGATGPADVAIVGNETDVERQVRAVAETGATDFIAWTFPVGTDSAVSVSRTWALLKGLVNHV